MTSTMTRPVMSIERLPGTMTNRLTQEQREVMNCKSCRRRKIKCNRMKPKCESCKLFQCPCLYDAVPKKRGPKTEVLENLLKRVDELEKKHQGDPLELAKDSKTVRSSPGSSRLARRKNSSASRVSSSSDNVASTISPMSVLSEQPSSGLPVSSRVCDTFGGNALFDIYFSRVHNRPYHIVEEATVRQQHHLGRLPLSLQLSIWSVAACSSQALGYESPLQRGEEYAIQARAHLDIDEPSLVTVQSLLLLNIAFFTVGSGKKAYTCLSLAISMAMALELHRELPGKAQVDSATREIRRQVYWTCYMLDRFSSCGSKRPILVPDDVIILRLPSWTPYGNSLSVEGEFFSSMNFRPQADAGAIVDGTIVMLIDVTRILGTTNKYLANGGVKGEMHFPWHSSSSLFQIRTELDIWATSNRDKLVNDELFLSRSDGVVLFLSKLIYHLVHTMVYRPFLPVDLEELGQGSGQHKSFQIEATHLCFLHANAITELVTVASRSPTMDWPSLVGYALTTAGSVHIHGAHYKSQKGDVCWTSSECLAREIQMLTDLQYQCASLRHQKDTLQAIFIAHSEMIKAPSTNPFKYSPVFHLKDFFDRYAGRSFDGAFMSLQNFSSSEHGIPKRRESMPSRVGNMQTQLHIEIPPSSIFASGPQTAPIRNSSCERASRLHGNTSAPLQPNFDFGKFPITQPASLSTALPYSQITTSEVFPQVENFEFDNTERIVPAAEAGPLVETANEQKNTVSDYSTESPLLMQDEGSSLGGEDDIDPFMSILEQFAGDQSGNDFDVYLDGIME